MAFRKFGGLNYATNNNIVHNTYSNTKNLTVSNQVGSQNSNILVQSNFDMSGNSLFDIGEAHFETGFITSNDGLLTFDNSSTVSSGLDLNAGTGITLRGMDFNNAQGTTFQFNTTNGGTISLHNQTVSVATGDINLTTPTGQTIFIDPLLTVPKITTRPDTDLFISTGSSDGYLRIDRDVGITGNIIQLGDSLFQGNVGITGTLGVTGSSVFDGSVGVSGLFGVTGSSIFDGSVGVSGLFGVTGSSTFNGAATFDGTSTFNGSIIFNGSIGVTDVLGATGGFGVTGASIFNGSVGITGTLGVTGSSTFDGSVGITGLLGVTGPSVFNGTVEFVDYVPTCKIGPIGNYDLTNKQYVNSVISAGGATLLNNNNDWYGTNTFNNSLAVNASFDVTGASVFNGNVNVKNVLTLDASLALTSHPLSTLSQFDLSCLKGTTGGVIQNQLDGKVNLTGAVAETITGAKTFSSDLTLNNSSNLVLGASSNLVLGSSNTTLDQTELARLNGIGSAIITVAAAQTISGTKTFSNLKLNGDLALTSPDISLTQIELARLDGVGSEIVTVGAAQTISGAKTFSGTTTFNNLSITNFASDSTTNFNGTTTFNSNLILGASSNLVLGSSNTTLDQTELARLNGVDSEIVKVGSPQTISGTKTFSNLKLNGDLALTSPDISLTQIELARLDGVGSEIVTVEAAQTISGAKTFSGTTTFNNLSTTNFASHSTTNFSGTTTFNSNITLGASSKLTLSNATEIDQTELAYLNGVDSEIVKVGSPQNISGTKTFSNLKLNGDLALTTPNVTVTQINLSCLDVNTSITSLLSGKVNKTGNESIDGLKTFTGGVKAQSFDATSDYRIKQNVINLDDTYKLDNLRPVSYYNTKTCSQNLGFIAHEVQQEIPHIVSGEKDGEQLQSINYNGLIPILVKELNEQKQENKQNKELINKLMQSNEYLMKHVNELIKKLL